jgi:hypothetical protein
MDGLEPLWAVVNKDDTASRGWSAVHPGHTDPDDDEEWFPVMGGDGTGFKVFWLVSEAQRPPGKGRGTRREQLVYGAERIAGMRVHNGIKLVAIGSQKTLNDCLNRTSLGSPCTLYQAENRTLLVAASVPVLVRVTVPVVCVSKDGSHGASILEVVVRDGSDA